jgi:GNAT superfamily N-acetyltransferase
MAINSVPLVPVPVTLGLAAPNEFSMVEAFYHRVEGDEDLKLTMDERIILAHNRGLLVGVVRLVKEQGVLVLRTLHVLESYRGLGIGYSLVSAAIKFCEGKPCYCLPYPHVKNLYLRLGFKELKVEELPVFLRERIEEYRKEFPVIGMMREG